MPRFVPLLADGKSWALARAIAKNPVKGLLFSVLLLSATALCGLTPIGRGAAAAEPIQELRDVVYARRGPLELKADVYLPPGAGPFPGVLMVHGGAWRGGSKLLDAPRARELAGHGYSVMAIDYRLAPEFKFPAQIEDCRDAVRFLRREARQYKIDPTRVAGFGYSAGGHLVCLLGTEHDSTAPAGGEKPTSTRLQAVVAGGAPCDFRKMPDGDNLLSFWLGGTRREKPALYLAASPRAFVARDDPPMFLFHGAEDEIVPKRSAEMMVDSLKKQGVPAELYIVPGAGHVGAYLDPKAFDEAVKFLDRTLQHSPPKKERPITKSQ